MLKYFIRYAPEEDKEPYKVPENLRKQLVNLGVNILSEGEILPHIIVKMSKDKVKDVESLERVVGVFEDIQFD